MKFNFKKILQTESGFTLIEIMITSLILCGLMLYFGDFMSFQSRMMKQAEDKKNASQIADGIRLELTSDLLMNATTNSGDDD